MSVDALLREIGGRLRSVRLGRNESQEELARRAGVGKATLQRLEDGRSGTLTTLVRVMHALDLDEGLDALVPEPGPRPLEEVRRRSRERVRARGGADQADSPPASPWRWGDEAGGDR